MASGSLYLLGGGPAIDTGGDPFMVEAGRNQARIVVLLTYHPRWRASLPFYHEPLDLYPGSELRPVVPDENNQLDLDAAREALEWATGIMIGGGSTAAYRELYAEEPMAIWIRKRNSDGIPIMGVSAGALLLLEHALMTPAETGEETVTLGPGLGLINDLILGVHYTEDNALPEMLPAMVQARISQGFGIDEPTYAVFREGRLVRFAGGSAYRVLMTGFDTQAHTVERLKAGE